jgi:hypothetical protein
VTQTSYLHVRQALTHLPWSRGEVAVRGAERARARAQAAFVLPRKLLTDAARYFVQAPRAYQSAAPGVSLLDRIEMCCRSDVQLPRQLRDKPGFAFLKAA